MEELYERYMKGFHQEVYDEILVRNEEIFDKSLSQDVQLVLCKSRCFAGETPRIPWAA